MKEWELLTQNMLVKPAASQMLLSFSISNVDGLFSGFTLGDFALLHGSSTILPLSLLLCVRAQLPIQLGGLGASVVFIDGGNTFRFYEVSRIAQLHQLNPKQVLDRIYVSRAFTAYQITSIIFEKLKEAVNRFNSKLVIVSDIAGLYLDKDIPATEAREIFNQSTLYLSKFSKENQVIIIATYLPHDSSKQNTFFHSVAYGRANVVVSIRPSRFGQEFVLEKHPYLSFGRVKLPSENLELDRFMESYG